MLESVTLAGEQKRNKNKNAKKYGGGEEVPLFHRRLIMWSHLRKLEIEKKKMEMLLGSLGSSRAKKKWNGVDMELASIRDPSSDGQNNSVSIVLTTYTGMSKRITLCLHGGAFDEHGTEKNHQ